MHRLFPYKHGRAKIEPHQIDDLEEKFREAMINNPQLDNEKQSYLYQIEKIKDDLEEMEENYYRLQRDYKDKSRNYELLTRDFSKIKDEYNLIKECLKIRDKLLEENGLVLITNGDVPTLVFNGFKQNPVNGELKCALLTNGVGDEPLLTNGDVNGDSDSERDMVNGYIKSDKKTPAYGLSRTLISIEAANILNEIEGVTLEQKLKSIAYEKDELKQDIKRLKAELAEEREKNGRNGDEHSSMDDDLVNCSDMKLIETQRETNRLLHEYKFKYKKAEQEINSLQNTVTRLETQLARHKLAAEEAEKLEEGLKTEKRKVLREFREAQARIEELETANAHLQKRIDKLKSNRMAIINGQ